MLLEKFIVHQASRLALVAFESFKEQWAAYPGAINVWTRNFQHIEQFFDYGSAIRKVTTNAVKSIYSSFRKVTKKGAFPNENALLKVLFLRIKELEIKWEDGRVPNWALVMNQLLIHDDLKDRVLKYLEQIRTYTLYLIKIS